MYAFKRKIPDTDTVKESSEIQEAVVCSDEAEFTEAAENEGINDMIKTLTKRELEVLDLIGCGYSNSEIAKALFISEHTVNDYTKKIYRKLDVHSRYAAAQFVNKK